MRATTRKIDYATGFAAGGTLVGGAALTFMSDAGVAKSLSPSAFGVAIAML